ncbi:unnamed protein product [Parnassius apollo]|uniref:(apollo) hypothetical protein n=1 Tax=Parnassius apollo TaxID=110799 RepID=A0A8S3WQG8_PARAO|nr:unnamed protein product [Parnassius apollo]
MRSKLEESMLETRSMPLENRPRLPHIPLSKRNRTVVRALNPMLVTYLEASRDLCETDSFLFGAALAVWRIIGTKLLMAGRATRQSSAIIHPPHTNLASIMAKFDLFLHEVNTHKPAFILISETHLHSVIDDRYTLFRLDRRERKGGGVAMYVAHDVNNVPVISKVNKIYYNSLVEALWLDIRYGFLDLLLACVYRPPSNVLTSADEILFNTIEKVASKQTVINAGDFNLPYIKWPLDNLTRHDKLCESFVAMYSNSKLNQLVTQITRKRNNAESLLDLRLCNDETLITDIKYIPPIGKSDHLVILASMQIINNDNKVPIKKIFDFYKADYSKINKDLAENFNIIENQVDEMWLSFKNQNIHHLKIV